MPPSTRPTNWFASWSFGNPSTQKTVRVKEAQELVNAITTSHHDKDTLIDLHHIVVHETLCHRLRNDDDPDLTRTFSDHPITDHFPVAFTHNWATSLLSKLSQCIIHSTTPSAHLERELQWRLILATISLLYVQGAVELQAEYFNKFRRSIESRFTELRWQAGTSGLFSEEALRKVQCSFLLSAISEYSGRFRKAEPKLITILERVKHILSAGLVAVGPAMGGTINLSAFCSELEQGLKAITHKPNDRYQGLFALTELTNLASSLRTFSATARSISAMDGLATKASVIANGIQNAAQKSALLIIKEHGNFEESVSPPNTYWSNFRAAINLGPPGFDEFYYLYGIIDCMTSLVSCGKDGSAPPSELTLRMKEMVRNTKEPVFRWKAVEYLIAATRSSDDDLTNGITNRADPDGSKFLSQEILHIRQTIDRQRRHSAVVMSDRRPSTLSDSPARLERKDWKEEQFAVPILDSKASQLSLDCCKGRRKPHLAAGLSPNCKAAFLLDKGSAKLFSIHCSKTNLILDITDGGTKTVAFKHASLSDKYFAAISEEELGVWAYSTSSGGSEIGKLAKADFPLLSDGSRWMPRCLAIHDSVTRSWIAVGGETASHGPPRGSISVYEVQSTNTGPKIQKHDHSFGQAKTPEGSEDVLKGALIKSISFSEHGGRLICLTSDNRGFIWFLSNNMRPKFTPFQFGFVTAIEPGGQGLTSATVFHSKAGKPYSIVSTWPSTERVRHGGEWSFITPVGMSRVEVSPDLNHAMMDLKKAAPIIASAASPGGDVIALMDRGGQIMLLPLKASSKGGLRSDGIKELGHRLHSQDKTCPAAMRFKHTEKGLELFAIDRMGNILYKSFGASFPPPNELQSGPADDQKFYA